MKRSDHARFMKENRVKTDVIREKRHSKRQYYVFMEESPLNILSSL